MRGRLIPDGNKHSNPPALVSPFMQSGKPQKSSRNKKPQRKTYLWNQNRKPQKIRLHRKTTPVPQILSARSKAHRISQTKKNKIEPHALYLSGREQTVMTDRTQSVFNERGQKPCETSMVGMPQASRPYHPNFHLIFVFRTKAVGKVVPDVSLFFLLSLSDGLCIAPR